MYKYVSGWMIWWIWCVVGGMLHINESDVEYKLHRYLVVLIIE